MENKTSQRGLLPVFLSFFVMSFCDLAGITIDRVKSPDIFSLGDFAIQFIPSVVFVWFFFLSIPVGVWQDRYGKKNILNAGMIITALGMFIPYFLFSKAALFIGFALLGIGNTIVQVSANPLLLDVVAGKKASYMSFSQFIKAVGSMTAPYAAAFCADNFGDWKLMFLFFGVTSLLSVLWLRSTPIEESKNTERRATIASALGLLKNNYVAFMALGIFLLVGLDVGINSISGQFFVQHYHSASEYAEKARSFFFFLFGFIHFAGGAHDRADGRRGHVSLCCHRIFYGRRFPLNFLAHRRKISCPRQRNFRAYDNGGFGRRSHPSPYGICKPTTWNNSGANGTGGLRFIFAWPFA